MSTHFPADVLADAAAGVLSSDLTAEVDQHVADCPDCADVAEALASVPGLLGADAAQMPVEVWARLDATVSAEAARRVTGEAAAELARRQSEHAGRLTTGTFGRNAPTRRHPGVREVGSPDSSQLPHLTG